MLELPERLGFDLTDTLTGDPECLSDVLKRLLSAVFQPVAHPHDLCFALCQGGEHLIELLLQHGIGGRLVRRGRLIVRDEVTEVAVLLLTDREAKVMRMRYGLENGRQQTLEDVGKALGVTRERIRQIEAKALRKLKHYSRSKKLQGYID